MATVTASTTTSTWRCRACDTYTPRSQQVCMVCETPAPSPLVVALADIDLSDTTHPGGIHGAVETAAQIIREHVETAHTGHPAPVIPITTASRSAAA